MPALLGLVCINTELRKRGIFCSRKPILSTIEKKGIDYLKKCCLENLDDLMVMLKWNAENGIRVFRLSSDLFPHKSNPRIAGYTLDFAQDMLTKIGVYARQTGQRLTFHPGPYNIVGSHNTDRIVPYVPGTTYPKDTILSHDGILWTTIEPSPTPSAETPLETPSSTPSPEIPSDQAKGYKRCTSQRTIDDLSWQAEVLDRLGCDQHSVMVVHGGATYGNKPLTKKRWIRNYALLPEPVRRRLVLENCEKCFSITDCLDISAICGVPVVFDTHHYTCYAQLHPAEKFEPESAYIPAILETWHRRNIKPKFHVSEQACCGKVGKHSDFIERIPAFLLDITEDIDIMIEAKQKELAIQQLYKVHPELDLRLLDLERKRKHE